MSIYTFTSEGLEKFIFGAYNKLEEIVGFDEIPEFILDSFREIDPSFLDRYTKEEILTSGRINEIIERASDDSKILYNHFVQQRLRTIR